MYRYFKRLFDFCAALVGLVVLAPFFLLILALIKAESTGSVFFKQKRFGKDEKFFYIYKFRTMRVDAPKDTPTHLLEDPGSYITRIGRFLRRFSLDELPQLLNIIKGDMAIVGPRPALWNQDDLMALRSDAAKTLLPGLTGLAQIRGRDELPLDVKAAFDNEYAEKIGVTLDLYIIFYTVKIAVSGAGVCIS